MSDKALNEVFQSFSYHVDGQHTSTEVTILGVIRAAHPVSLFPTLETRWIQINLETY